MIIVYIKINKYINRVHRLTDTHEVKGVQKKLPKNDQFSFFCIVYSVGINQLTILFLSSVQWDIFESRVYNVL